MIRIRFGTCGTTLVSGPAGSGFAIPATLYKEKLVIKKILA